MKIKKQIENLIKRTVGGGEHKDWFMELEDGIIDIVDIAIQKSIQSERSRIFRELNKYLGIDKEGRIEMFKIFTTLIPVVVIRRWIFPEKT